MVNNKFGFSSRAGNLQGLGSGGVGHGSRDFIRPITRRTSDTYGGCHSFGLYVNPRSFSINVFCYPLFHFCAETFRE